MYNYSVSRCAKKILIIIVIMAAAFGFEALYGQRAHAAASKAITINKKTVKHVAVKALINKVRNSGGMTDTIILGSNVKTIKARAFSGTSIKTLTVKSKKLTAKSVKGSLKGSKIKTIEVSAGSKKINKKLVKKYKKFLTKKNAGKKVTVKVKSSQKKPVPEPTPGIDQDKMSMVHTSLSIFRYLCSEDSTRNVLISPDSILTAMTMVENGAMNNTLAEMETAFGMGLDEQNKLIKELNDRLTSSKSVKYHIANSIWYKDDKNEITVNDDFIKKNLDFFGAEIYKAPFSAETVSAINDWVSRNTDYMINKIINKLNKDTVMLLINAIAFEGEWAEQYDGDQVSEQPFFDENGNVQKQVCMLSGKENIYVKICGANGFIKPYAGGEIAFLGLETPKDMTADQFIQKLNAKDFITGYNERSTEYNVNTRMPEFRYDFDTSLVSALMNLGIRDAFSDMSADFSGITPPNQPLVISDVLHKTYIEVDQYGTKAAAATAVIMDKASSAPVKKPEINVSLDHPFVYAIIDTRSGMPLFIGTVKRA